MQERQTQAAKERDEAHQAFLNLYALESNPETAGTKTPESIKYGTAEAARQAWKDAEAAYQDAANAYYDTENRGKLETLQKDAASFKTYEAAKELEADLKKVQEVAITAGATGNAGTDDLAYLKKKYGVDTDSVFTLQKSLQEKLDSMKGDLDTAGYSYDRLSGFQTREIQKGEYEAKVAEWQSFADEHPVLASAASVLVAPFQGIDFVKMIGSGSLDDSDPKSYVPPSVYDADLVNFVNTVRSTVSEQIDASTDWEIFGQNVASFLYQTGLSIAESAAQVAAMGPAATYFMGASAAAGQAANVIERGGTTQQALLGGLASGVAEGFFEKFSVERLLDPTKFSTKTLKDTIRSMAAQAGTEASEESFTEISNIISDAIIMSRDSSFELSVQSYQNAGMTREEAERQAFLDSIGQVVWAGVGGALSGVSLGGARLTYAKAAETAGAYAEGAQLKQRMSDGVDTSVFAEIQKGMDAAEGSEARSLAESAQKQLDSKKRVSNATLGRLVWANQANAIQDVQALRENMDDPAAQQVMSQVAQELQTSGTLTSAMVGPAHVITSMYGRDNFGKFFSDAVQSGDLLYVNKKRIDPMLTTAGYQSSGLLSGIDSQTILGQITPNVNTKERRYSLSETEDGQMVAVVDDDILKNIDTSKWTSDTKNKAKAAAKSALENFKDGIHVYGVDYKINRTSRREYTRSESTERLYRKAPEIFADKMRSAANIPDIVAATSFGENDGGLRHPRADSFVDFVHGIALIQSGQNQYKASVVVGITSGKENVFYDISDLSPTSFALKKESPTTASGREAVGDIQGDSSVTNIPDYASDVKEDTRYSITPEFEQWYKENYGVEGDLTDAQLRRALQRQERKAQRAEESAQAARTKAKVDAENTLTAWLVYHKKNMRRLSRDLQKKSADRVAELRREKAQALQDKDLAWRIYHEAKIREQRAASQQAEKDLRKEMTQQTRDAVRTATEVERAKAAVQRDADVMAFKRQAAERLRIKSGQYTELKEKTREQTRLKRKAAERALKDSRQAAKKRAEKEIQNGAVKTIRDIPAERKRIERLQEQAKNLKTLFRPAYAAFVNQAKAIDDFAKRQSGGVLSSTLVNVLGGSSTTIESVFKRGLVDRSGNRIGDAMKDVFLVWDGKKVDEAKQALLQDYMLHAHNVDRMSFVKNARARLEAFEAENPWLRDMDQKEFAKLVAMTEAEIEKTGKQKAHNLAVQYAQLLDRYNRSQDKPIFADADGNAVTAETSRTIVEQYLAENPWLEEKAQGIYAWWDLFMRTWAVGDSLTLEQYEVMREIYPHYVPTYRADKKGVGAANFVGAGGATIGTAVKKAKGGLSEVVNIEDSFANLANKIIKLARTNELYKNIIDTALLEDGADSNVADMAVFDWDSVTMGDSYKTESGEVVSVFSNGFDMSDRVDEAERPGLLKSKDGYKLSAWYDGQLLSAYISEDLYKSIARVTGSDANDISRAILKVGNTLTGPMKTAITGINPAFAMRNISRDLPTAVVNSISGAAFVKYYGRALAEMKRNSENWQVFQALGGTHAGYYNNNKGFAGAMAQRDNILARTGAALGRFNDITEAQTRFAEYLATIDRLGDTYENRLLGIKNAAEVTVDFSRKGWAGKYINAWVPYWNPAVQGIDKVVRSVIDSPDGSAVWKQASRTLGRAALGTVMLEAILQIVLAALGRRDEWEQLDDRTKDTYYCIPLADSYTFLKIPKNREWGSILGTPFMRLLEWANGRDDPFENYLETSIIPNFLPPLPSDTVGFSQWNDLTTNEDFAGRAIVPYAYEQGSLTEQYDADTSTLAYALGKLLKFSPMQIDYIISDYFGDWADLLKRATPVSGAKNLLSAVLPNATVDKLIPLPTDGTVVEENGFVRDAVDIFFGGFEADARYSNAAVSKYYDTMDRLSRVVQDKKNHMGTDAAKETIEYQTQTAINKLYGNAITDLNTEVRSLPDGEEKDAAKAEIARLAAEAMDFYEQSLAGNIEAPALQAEYEEYTPTVRKALIDLDEYSEDYKFKPTGNASASYTDPADDTREYVLTEDQKDQFHTIYVNQYNTMVGDLINQSRYSSATGEVKAEMLEDLRDDVLDQTKEEFFNWLVSAGVRSTAKAK